MESGFGNTFRIENAALATESGLFAMQNISRRFQQILPNILTETYSPDRFHFRHSGSPRTNDSIRAFTVGLFGKVEAANVVYEPISETDWLLRPFDFCPLFWEETADWSRHQDAFELGPEVQELIQQVNRKLGFLSTNQLNFTQIFVMWNWCRQEIALTFETSGSETGPNSPWCAAFSVSNHLILEYYEDLRPFYLAGYGIRNQRLRENLNCGLMQDLLRHMQSENDADAMARIFVTYTEEFQLMLVALGVFRDLWPLHEHNFAQQSGRLWLSSLISSFSSNLSVVRFE